MAKRKTPKKEKIVDLKPEKITDEQLEHLQKTINSINRSQLEIGSVELRKHELLHHIAGFREELGQMQKVFTQEYGTFDININDGTINYMPEDPKTQENGEANKED
tara:strand:- start:168 stop:485 length:318 start_codon:yes stop_codon:yes gene_type:complete